MASRTSGIEMAQPGGVLMRQERVKLMHGICPHLLDHCVDLSASLSCAAVHPRSDGRIFENGTGASDLRQGLIHRL